MRNLTKKVFRQNKTAANLNICDAGRRDLRAISNAAAGRFRFGGLTLY